jgi:ABC-type methionine transport system permease subunit
MVPKNANKKHTGALNNSAQALNEATNRLNSKFIIIFASTFVALVIVLFVAIFLYVPSMDEIQQRRVDKKALDQYALQKSSKNL